MSNDKKIAANLIETAARTILQDRPGVHGDTENSFHMIADLWNVYMRHVTKTRETKRILPEDVANMMSLLKKARAVYGDPKNIDNFVDDIGYTALAGMLKSGDVE